MTCKQAVVDDGIKEFGLCLAAPDFIRFSVRKSNTRIGLFNTTQLKCSTTFI
jgi:hypothetical protein